MGRGARSARKHGSEAPSQEAADSEASPVDVLLSAPARRTGAVPGILRARIVGTADDGRPLVTWPGAPREPVPAEVVWMSDPPRWADCAGLAAVIGFEDGDLGRPLLLGLLAAPPGRPDEAPDAAQAEPPRCRRIESGEELVLQCGEAKIVLRADGSVTILGAKVVSRARGVHKIKGGSVQIN